MSDPRGLRAAEEKKVMKGIGGSGRDQGVERPAIATEDLCKYYSEVKAVDS